MQMAAEHLGAGLGKGLDGAVRRLTRLAPGQTERVPLARIQIHAARAHRAAAPLQDEGSYLGLIGLAALGLLISSGIAAVIRNRANSIPMEVWQVLWIVLCFSTGGLNTILGAFGFTLFRTGCRYSIVILAIALVYAAQRLTALGTAAAFRIDPETLRIGTLCGRCSAS